MNGNASSAPIVNRESHINEALNRLSGMARETEQECSELATRLVRVLREEPPSPNGQGEEKVAVDDAQSTPLAAELINIANGLKSANRVLQGIMRRLEL